MPRRHKRMKAPSKANCKKTLKRVPKPNRKHTCEFVGRTIECGLPVSDGKCDPLSSNMSDSCCDSSHRLVQIGDGPHPQDCAVCDYSDCEFRYVTHQQMSKWPPMIHQMAQQAVSLSLRGSLQPINPEHLRLAALCSKRQGSVHFLVMWDQKRAEQHDKYDGGDLCLMGWDELQIPLSTCLATGEELELPGIALRRGDVIKISNEGRLDYQRPLAKQDIYMPWLLDKKKQVSQVAKTEEKTHEVQE